MSKIQECWNCRFYKAYYTKGACQFVKQKSGYCGAQKQIILNKHNFCDRWCNDITIKHMRHLTAIKKIDETLESLMQIKQILAEEKEELKKPDIKVMELPGVKRKVDKSL